MIRSLILRVVLLTIVCVSLGSLVSHAQIALPLHTSGHQILDAKGNPVRLNSVNWYGFDEKEYVAGGLDHAPLAAIVKEIHALGVNSVRLPWANETLERNPLVADYAVQANPQLKGKHAMDVMDAVIHALAKDRIMVILDNHVSRADWCCSEKDGNGLWYSSAYPETKWLADWQTIVRRYKNEPWVIGADLRNELRSGAVWGGTDPTRDWHAAAERGGNAVLAANPRLLIMVEGPEYSTNFIGFDKLPVHLKVANRLVYSPHAYNIAQHPFASYEELKQLYDARAGFLLHTEPGVPLWVGEFGTCQTLDCGANSDWFRLYIRYIKENNLSWSYWPLNGTQSSGEGRKYDSAEGYGLLSSDYQHIAAPKIVELLRTVEDQPQR
ncbi:MAG TPA: glycoside hydrolase family 5 protein [Acidisarcina sp.]|nr:glycoside hydrolase family 5 protein [Acidisarcina sp.]